MDNQEILNRFDILYNNIMSNQAPGLDGYEKSVFWNKAQLEVLKNHLNPKGNKYGEGFDGSAKRQVDFSSLILKSSVNMPYDSRAEGYTNGFYRYAYNSENQVLQQALPISIPKNILSTVNESVDTITIEEFGKLQNRIREIAVEQFAGEGGVNIISSYIDWVSHLNVDEETKQFLGDKVYEIRDQLLKGDSAQISVLLYFLPPLEELLKDLEIQVVRKTVVPINNVELDTLTSRPYGYPPKSQVWRITIDDVPEFMPMYGLVPITYHMRYVKKPKDVDLTDNNDIPEVPEVLYDEILQRAVELAKNSWEGNIETTKAFGERSE